MTRAVVIKSYGDPKIAEAIRDGMTAALPAAKPLEPDEVRVVRDELDRQRTTVGHLVRVAVGNTLTPDDYRLMTVKARGDYSRLARPLGPVRRTLLIGWAVVWLLILEGFAELWERIEGRSYTGRGRGF